MFSFIYQYFFGPSVNNKEDIIISLEKDNTRLRHLLNQYEKEKKDTHKILSLNKIQFKKYEEKIEDIKVYSSSLNIQKEYLSQMIEFISQLETIVQTNENIIIESNTDITKEILL